MAKGAFSLAAMRAEFLRQRGDPSLFDAYIAEPHHRKKLVADIQARLDATRALRRRLARRKLTTNTFDLKKLQANDKD
ncbi:hypothetical protein [Cupriavidus alkaliphilus]|uniref:hypothetical protein n=1 Tax=Cupriavidus alkaliphilus TaxID=942866 RepID=UPI00339D34D9